MSRGSVSVSTITIKLKERKNAKPKKAIVPSALSSLKIAAAKLFGIQPPKSIQSVYLEDGTEITSISEVTPGMTIIVSTKPADSDFSAAKGGDPDKKLGPKGTEQAVLEEAPDPSVKSSTQSTVSIGLPPKRIPPPPSLETAKLAGSPSNTSLLSKSGSRTSLQQLPSQPSRPTSSMGSSSHPASPRPSSPKSSGLAVVAQSNEGSFNRNPSPRAGSPPRSAKSKKGPDFVEEEGDVMIPPTEEELDQQRFEQTGISFYRMKDLMDTIDGLNVDGHNILNINQKVFEEVMSNTPPIVQRVATRAKEAQSIQKAVIYNKICQLIGEIPQHTSTLDASVASVLNRATFATQAGSNVVFRTAIIGPQGSGKSTFMKTLLKAAADRMFASGQFKRTLIFYMDSDLINTNDALEIYRNIITGAIDCVTAARIEIEPFAEILKNYFCRMITLDKATPIPQKFSLEDDFRSASFALGELATNVYNALHEVRSLHVFLTDVFMIPLTVAHAFGFSDVLYAIDHLDTLDVDCALDSTGIMGDDVTPLPLIEFAKLMASTGSFIVTCRNEDRLIEALDMIADDTTDLMTGTDLVTVVGADSGNEHSSEIDICLKIESEKVDTYLRRDDCGGCPGFLARWDDIVSMSQSLLLEERRSKDGRRAREAKLALLAKIRELAALVFEGDEDEDGVYHQYAGYITDFEVSQNSAQSEED